MVAINKSDGPVRLKSCAPLYALQPKWTARLATQMTLYVAFIGSTMAAGALMPWMLQKWHGWAIGDQKSLHKLFTQEGFVYDTNNSYSFCPKNRLVHYEPLQRGYPAAPLDPRDGRLTDAWSHRELQLAGVSWFGFSNGQGSIDGLWAGGSAAATDLQAIVHQLKLLGFNTIRLPFTFDRLTDKAKDQVTQCTPGTKSSWARRATDPAVQPQPEFASAPDPAVFLRVDSANLCNTYLPGPGSTVLERLLWMVQFLTASGFYVILDNHPSPDDPTALDPHLFASSWLMLWATITCLPNFSADIRGRLLLDLLNEPDKLGPAGIAWTRRGDVPGLQELYLSAMDSIEHVTPGDALFLLQGSAMTNKANKFGLSPGDGFVTASEIITAYGLSDPKPFFNTLLSRSYRSRVLLAPHLYPSVAPESPEQLLAKLNSSWGVLALEGYCQSSNSTDQLCMRFPVVAGELGSMLDTVDERAYYRIVSLMASAAFKPESAGLPANATLPQLAGWIWWALNANSNGTGGLVSPGWQQFLWPTLRFLVDRLGLQPWYKSPEAFIRNEAAVQADALQARGLADAAAAAALAEANTSQDMNDLTVVMMDGQPDNSSSSSSSSDDNSHSARAAGTAGMDVPALVETTSGAQDVPAVVEMLAPAAPTSSALVAPAAPAADLAAAAVAVRPLSADTPQPQPDRLPTPSPSAGSADGGRGPQVVELVDVPAVVGLLPAHHQGADGPVDSGGT